MENDSSLLLYGCLVAVFPIAIIVAYVRRQRAKKKYYAAPAADEGPIEGSLDELNRVDENASPWRNDEIARIKETMDLIERFDTMRGYTESTIEEMKALLTKNGIANDSVFLEGYPIGAVASLTTRMGIYELYADRKLATRAKQLIEEFRSR